MSENKWNYEKQKFGWIKFKDNRPKVKLRKVMSDFSRTLLRHKGGRYKEYRRPLIIAYDRGGMPEVITKFNNLMNTFKKKK
jgi:hypothetical protein